MLTVTVLLGVLGVVLLLPTFSDIVSLGRWLGSRSDRRNEAPKEIEIPRLLFLVPAHDEELLIGECLRSLLNLRYPREWMRVVVIADNCTDGTAEIAREMGVDCFERSDLERRGKPWAISWALTQLHLSDYDGVIIIDADSEVDPDFAKGLSKKAPLSGIAVQTFNDVRNQDESVLTRMASVFGISRCVLQFGLKDRARINVPLSNGMCVGTGVLQEHGWTAFSICEDWEVYAILTAAEVRIEYCGEARVGSQEAKSLKQSSSQRKRWAAGKLTVLRIYASRILRSPIGAAQKLDALAELTAPGPVVHLGFVGLLVALTALLNPPFAPWVIALLSASLARQIVFSAIALGKYRDPWGALLAFSVLPVYAVWRIGVQISALTLPKGREWIRTSRHLESGGG